MSKPLVKNKMLRGIICDAEDMTAPGGMMGLSDNPRAMARAFACTEGEPLSLFNKITENAVKNGLAATLEGDWPASLYLDAGKEAFLQYESGTLPQRPQSRSGPAHRPSLGL